MPKGPTPRIHSGMPFKQGEKIPLTSALGQLQNLHGLNSTQAEQAARLTQSGFRGANITVARTKQN